VSKDNEQVYFKEDGEFIPMTLVPDPQDFSGRGSDIGSTVGRPDYNLKIPMDLHEEFQRIADSHGVEPLLLYKQAFASVLKAHELQEGGTGVYIKDKDGEFQQVMVGGIGTIDGLFGL